MKIDKNLFDNFPVNSITCWEHLEIWATIHNFPINKNFICFIISGGVYFKILYDIILNAIKYTNYLDKYINDISIVELIYNFYNTDYIDGSCSLRDKWIKYIRKNKLFDITTNTYWNYKLEENNKIKYNLFLALSTRFPMLLIQFYNKNKKMLHSKDEAFVNWLLEEIKIKSYNDIFFSKIYNAILIDIKNQRNIKMYLN